MVEVGLSRNNSLPETAHQPTEKIPRPLFSVRTLSPLAAEDLRRAGRRSVPVCASLQFLNPRATLMLDRLAVRLGFDPSLSLPAQPSVRQPALDRTDPAPARPRAKTPIIGAGLNMLSRPPLCADRLSLCRDALCASRLVSLCEASTGALAEPVGRDLPAPRGGSLAGSGSLSHLVMCSRVSSRRVAQEVRRDGAALCRQIAA